MSRILVIIPAYEDFDLPRTVDEAIDKAYSPEQIHFVIGLQYKTVDINSFLDKYKDDDRFTFIHYELNGRPGVNRIRHELLQHHNGEEYLLLIDSHMNFLTYWDQVLINRYKDMQDKFGSRVVWSRPMSEFPTLSVATGEIDNTIEWIAAIDEKHQASNHNGVIRQAQTPQKWNGEPFIISTWITSHFAFMDSLWIKEVGIDPNVHQYCEEQLATIKTYLAGWTAVYDAILYPIGHSPQKTNMSLYGKEDAKYHDKEFGQVDSSEVKKEVARFLLTGYSDIIEVKTRQRDVADFYKNLGAEGLVEGLKLYLNIDA